MKNKVIQVPLSVRGIEKAIRELDEYKRWLKRCSENLLSKLADRGYQIASAKFQSVIYDGDNDTSVSVDDRGRNVKAVVAVGSSVLFIEFGTGIVYPDVHPEAAANGMNRGEYGKGRGKNRTWYYYGEPGSNGSIIGGVPGKGFLIATHGNPANMTMYNTVKELKSILPRLVKESFV